MRKVILKPVAVLFLCAALMLCSCGGNTQPPEQAATLEKQIGAFFEENGIWQNTLVRLVVSEEELTDPLTALSYAVHNDSDFDIVLNNTEDVIVEVYRDGRWIAPPASDGVEVREGEGRDEPKQLPANASWPLQNSDGIYPKDFAMKFGNDLRANYPHYKELTAGLYRIRIPYEFCDLPTDAPQVAPELVAYFTVNPTSYLN